MKRYILFVVCFFLSVIAKSQTIHWITFIDTEDSIVGHINTNSRRMLYNQFINVVNAALREKGYKSDIQEFYGSDFYPETCKAVVEQLSCRAEDIVIFYYIGQGTYQTNSDDKYPQMVMSSNLGSNKYMSTTWVHSRLKSKGARLTGTVCVSYDGALNTNDIHTTSTARGVNIFKLSEGQLKTIQELFTASAGDFIISSSARGQSSFGDITSFGNVDLLTSSLTNTVGKESLSTSTNLESIFNNICNVVISKSDGKQTPIFEFHHSTRSTPNVPSVSSVPSTSLILDLQDKNATRNKLTECFDNIIDSKQPHSQRYESAKKAESIFSSSARVTIINNNGATIDREDLSSYLQRISTDNKLLKVSPDSFKYDDTSLITEIKVIEYSKE